MSLTFAGCTGKRGSPARRILLLGGLLLLVGCATSSPQPNSEAHRQDPLPDDGGGFGLWGEKLDRFQLLQQSAGLEKDTWHEVGEALELDDARELYEALARTQTTLRDFGPKRTLLFVLRQVLTASEDVPYAQLVNRLEPFKRLVVMRPDGYLVWPLNGEPLQRMGRLELRDGRLMSGRFEVGAFFRNKGGVFYPVDDALQQAGWRPLGELSLERDWLNAALDGSEDALAEVVVALGHFVTEPVRSLQGLAQLPSAVAALITSSPEYFARYSCLPLQEQIQEAGRLSTHLLMLFGSTAGTATRMGTAGATAPGTLTHRRGSAGPRAGVRTCRYLIAGAGRGGGCRLCARLLQHASLWRVVTGLGVRSQVTE